MSKKKWKNQSGLERTGVVAGVIAKGAWVAGKGAVKGTVKAAKGATAVAKGATAVACYHTGCPGCKRCRDAGLR